MGSVDNEKFLFYSVVDCGMYLSRRKFIAGGFGSLVGLAGCVSPQSGSNKYEVDVWSNSNARIEAGVNGELVGGESRFRIELIVMQFVDYVWVVVDVPEDATMPAGGWIAGTSSDVAVGDLAEYGAVDGTVLVNEAVGEDFESGGVGSECIVNFEGFDELTVSVYGALEGGHGGVSTVNVLNVYQISR